jgi:hypothetical protein
MVRSISKFAVIWLGVAVVMGAVLFFASGSASSLNPAIEEARLANCQGAGGGFSGNQAQECLIQVERTLASLATKTRGDLMYWHMLSAFAVLILGLMFMYQLNLRAAIADTPRAMRSMRDTWWAYLLAIGAVTLMFGVLAHLGTFFGSWAGTLSPGRGMGVPAIMVGVWTAAFWGGTLSSAPEKMKPSIPGA